MNLMLGKAGAVRGQARRPDKGHKSNGSSRKKIGTFSGEGSVMKRFQLGLEREARPQRPVGKDWIGELQLTHEKSSRLWGWRGERAAVAKANNKHTSNTRLAVGGTLKRIPRERKQKRRRCSLLRRSCDGRQRNRVSNQSPGGTPGSPGHRKAVKWAGRLGEREGRGWLEKGSSSQWSEHKPGTPRSCLPRSVTQFCAFLVWGVGFSQLCSLGHK